MHWVQPQEISATLTSTVLIAEVGEPPDVAKANRISDAAEHEVALGAPLAARVLLAGFLHHGAILLLRLGGLRAQAVRS